MVTYFFILVSDFAMSFFKIDDGMQYVLLVDTELCECKIFGAMFNSRERLFSSICYESAYLNSACYRSFFYIRSVFSSLYNGPPINKTPVPPEVSISFFFVYFRCKS